MIANSETVIQHSYIPKCTRMKQSFDYFIKAGVLCILATTPSIWSEAGTRHNGKSYIPSAAHRRIITKKALTNEVLGMK